jgi:hypothetical protein
VIEDSRTARLAARERRVGFPFERRAGVIKRAPKGDSIIAIGSERTELDFESARRA